MTNRNNLIPIVVIIMLHLGLYHSHYLGISTFPWDFLDGYHAPMYSWYADGSFLKPLRWNPYTNFGYPTHLSLQNSSFYLPLALLDLLGLPLTVHTTTIVQCVHILLGAIGLFLLLRSYSISVFSCCVGAITFHLSAGFFSNAQHVDIIRGYSLIPWLMLYSRSRVILASRINVVVFVLIILLFITGVYPGLIISSVYSVLGLLLVDVQELAVTSEILKYLKKILTAILIASLLSSPKILPFLANISEIQPRSDIYSISSMSTSHLITLFFRPDIIQMPNDLTMRSIFIMPYTLIIFLGLYSYKPYKNIVKSGTILIIISLIFMLHPTYLEGIIPAYNLSRFPFSDYRPFLHIGIIFLSALSLDNLLYSSSFQEKNFKFLKYIQILFITFLFYSFTIYSLKLGIPYNENKIGYIIIFLTFAFLVAIWFLKNFRIFYQQSKLIQIVTYTFIIVSILFSSNYINSTSFMWNLSDYDDIYSTYYHFKLEDSIQKYWNIRKTEWKYRPERSGNLLIPSSALELISGNKANYTQTFSSNGNDNSLTMHRRLNLDSYLREAESSDIAHFLMSRSHVFLVNTVGYKDSNSELEIFCPDDKLVCNDREEEVSMEKYTTDSSSYHINLSKNSILVENEMYYPGWHAKIISNDSYSDKEVTIDSFSYHQFFRAWYLPKGSYRFITYYNPPLTVLSWILFSLGLAVLIYSLCAPRKIRI